MIYTNSKIKQSNGPGVTPEIIFVISRESSRTGGVGALRPEGRLRAISQNKVQGRPHPQEPSSPRTDAANSEGGPGGSLVSACGEKRCTGTPLQRTESSRETRFKNCAWVLVFPTMEGFTGWGQQSSCQHNPLGTAMRPTPQSCYLHSWTGENTQLRARTYCKSKRSERPGSSHLHVGLWE